MHQLCNWIALQLAMEERILQLKQKYLIVVSFVVQNINHEKSRIENITRSISVVSTASRKSYSSIDSRNVIIHACVKHYIL